MKATRPTQTLTAHRYAIERPPGQATVQTPQHNLDGTRTMQTRKVLDGHLSDDGVVLRLAYGRYLFPPDYPVEIKPAKETHA